MITKGNFFTMWAALLSAMVLCCQYLAFGAPSQVPGVVIDHIAASSGLYVGSPGIAKLANGDYLAAHDFFGPKSVEGKCPTVAVFRSSDQGASWKEVARLQCLFWQNIFTHRGAAYLMGTDKNHGRIVIRRSTDGGVTWTEAQDADSGLITAEGRYHTGPMPMVEHAGRLWRAFEDASTVKAGESSYQAMMLSIPADADLLKATNWTLSKRLAQNSNWLNGDWASWREGNAVLTRDGRIVDILRVDGIHFPEKAAVVDISSDGKTLSIDPATAFVDFPGGAKKFTIRFDPQSDLYWTLANYVPREFEGQSKPGGIRNTLALVSSKDLRQWQVRSIVLQHPDVMKHAFQYVDWLFEGADIIAASRTAYEDEAGGAHRAHDANYLTFHRIKNFRQLTRSNEAK